MSIFGHMPDQTPVERVEISGGGLTANVLSYGAVLQSLRLEGHDAPLVLGFPEFAPYLTQSPYFGATAGRCANRIRDGHLEIDGTTYQLDTNFLGKHSLHGGVVSMGKRVWEIHKTSESSVSLGISLADGEMGYPGNLSARVTFTVLDGGVFDVQMEASTDAPTLCNLAHHSYFNLSGEETISNHTLEVRAETYLPVDDELIPTGQQAEVTGTGFDFRQARPVSQAHKIDHNFCLSKTRQPIRTVAHVTSAKSGVAMAVRTTEPGLQVYDGAKIDIDLPGLSGAPMRAFAGLALEPQIWPDANHNLDFPQAILRPGEIYRQHTQFIFSKENR